MSIIVFDQLLFDFTNIHYLKVENKTQGKRIFWFRYVHVQNPCLPIGPQEQKNGQCPQFHSQGSHFINLPLLI